MKHAVKHIHFVELLLKPTKQAVAGMERSA
jgi:hypothetical protein